jgi:hypothetical protein
MHDMKIVDVFMCPFYVHRLNILRSCEEERLAASAGYGAYI